jgi:hypothetical protein
MPVLNYFQWSIPTAPNPRLAAPISATDTIITVTSAPKDHTGAVVTGNFLMGIKNEQSYTETVWVPVGAVSVDGLTLGSIGVPLVRGVRLEGLDYTTGDSTLAAAHNQDSPVYCNISAVNFVMMINALQGGIASGGVVWRLGKETDDSIYVYAQNADANKPYFRYDKVSNQWLYSNDGVSETPFGTGAGLTGGAGITIGAGVVDVDLTDTNVFTPTTAGAGDAGKAVVLNVSGLINKSIAEVLKDVTSTAAELNKLAGASANVTATNLNTLTAGSASNADALHTHTRRKLAYGNVSFAAGVPAATTIAHGFGVVPKLVRATGVCSSSSGSASSSSMSNGAYEGTNKYCVYFYQKGATGSLAGQATYGIYIVYTDAGLAARYGYATVTWDATNIYLTWGRDNANMLGTIYYELEAIT